MGGSSPNNDSYKYKNLEEMMNGKNPSQNTPPKPNNPPGSSKPQSQK